jgi:hypothetical protein
MEIAVENSGNSTTMANPSLEAMRLGNPAARSLPLLALLAANSTGQITLPYLDNLSLVLNVNQHDRG